MKAFFVLAGVIGILIIVGCGRTPAPKNYKQTFSSFDQPADHDLKSVTGPGAFNFENVRLDDVFLVYQQLSGRTVIHGPLPMVNVSCRTQQPVNRIEALQLLDTALALNDITMVLSGDDAVKAVPARQANAESPPNISLPWQMLPTSSSFMTRTVQLKNVRAVEAIPLLSPLAKLPNSIIVDQNHNSIILRDYSSNIRQQLQLLEKLENAPPTDHR
jgi:type II secretory pathway component GspD/PulD (secretin)